MKNIKMICMILLLLFTSNSFANNTKGQEMIVYKPQLTLKASKKYIEKAYEIATSKNLNLSIAVVDSSGQLLNFIRMDDASLVTIDVAIQKAKTAALLKKPLKFFEDKINQGATSLVTVPNLTPLEGGVPILCKNEVCGAIGVSGASGPVDNEVATKTVEALASEVE